MQMENLFPKKSLLTTKVITFDSRVERAVDILWLHMQFDKGLEARQLLEEAAKEGDADAYFFLARCYAILISSKYYDTIYYFLFNNHINYIISEVLLSNFIFSAQIGQRIFFFSIAFSPSK